MTAIGAEFNLIAKGSDTSASSPTIPGEAYWNFGWFGLVTIMMPMGVLLAVLSRYALEVFSSGRWILFPVLALGMGIGHRVDGHIVPDLIGMPVIMIGAHALLSLLNLGHGFLAQSRRAIDGEPRQFQERTPGREDGVNGRRR